MEQFRDMRRKLDMAVILITHNFGIISDFADKVAVMFRGKIVEAGETAKILREPQHPYTKALIQCIPKLGSRQKRLVTIDHAALDALA
jgi:ABC-type dipeptide/oligopeptide/nickel transport system ATPase component